MTLNSNLFISADSKLKGTTRLIGGKAENLLRLKAMNVNVPEWFALSTNAFRLAAGESGAVSRIADLTKKGLRPEELSEAARAIILSIQIPESIRTEFCRKFSGLFGPDDYVAVRSSATDEDNPEQSFAGLHDSFLFIKGADNALKHIAKVWASAYNTRAIAYRLKNGLRIDNIAIAVIIQKMINAETSGVMFTVNPVSGNTREIVISALYGAGEGLVSAGLDADNFTVNKADCSFTSQIATKEEMIILDPERKEGVIKTPVPEPRQTTPALDDAMVKLVARTGISVENAYGFPQDMEFSIDKLGTLFILQARPVTTAKEYGPAAGNHLIWDNSNIIESYSGVTSPMTFSFIRRAYTIVYNCFCEVMGVSSAKIAASQNTFSNMLGLFRGQVYYNLLNWYRLIRLFPGFNYNKQFMESMMGVKEPAELKDEYKQPTLLEKYFVELPALLRLLARSTLNFMRIRKLADSFMREFNVHYKEWDSMDFSSMKPHELIGIYNDMEKKLLWNWKAPIINDFFVMIFYGTLKKLCGKWCADTAGSLQNDLICGEGGIESTEPTKMLLRMAATAQKNKLLCDRIINESAETLVAEIHDDAGFAEFNALMTEYLDKYGFRCMNELKLEEYSLRDKPQFVYTIIRNYLNLQRPEALDVAAMARREANIRAEAEKKAFSQLGPLKSIIFRWVLSNARLGVKNRENMRFARTKIYGLLRQLIRALGGMFEREGILADREDIFYLSLDECFDLIKGTAITTDLKSLSSVRRNEFSKYREEAASVPDDRFETYGIAHNRNLFRNNPFAETREAPSGKLHGTGCCPGIVTGPVKVLRTPSDDMRLSGEILVAERTDPGWVPLYPSVSAVLIERGSILSHSAIVAREMGIPTIVGIHGLTAQLKSGMTVRMDGSAGTVEVVG